MADLALCMRRAGAGFCARQGWTGGGGSWAWRSETLEEEGAGVVVDQGLVPPRGCEGVLAGKRPRGELAGQPGRHSLWEHGPLGTGLYARQGRTGNEGTRPWWSVGAGLEGAGDVPQCPAPTGGTGGNEEVQAGTDTLATNQAVQLIRTVLQCFEVL